MGENSSSEGLTVCTKTVVDFFTNSSDRVRLPDYQRPYVWNTEKIEQLLQDWEEHFFVNGKFNNEAPYYYLGTVLFYKNKRKKEIIDGQQRITTLLLIDLVLDKNASCLKYNNWNLKYNSLLSSDNIKRNFKYLKTSTRLKNLSENIPKIFLKMIFTVIITKSQDEAFTFFDSQNNRGVSLGVVDFLKSYHLRELNGNVKIQHRFVKQWDRNNSGQFLNELFSQILWRARNWKGTNIAFENKSQILKSFQKGTIKEERNEVLKLYSNVNNLFASSLSYDDVEGILVQPQVLKLQISPDLYPFSLRQPIQKGIGFFLYAEKYFALHALLFKNKKVIEVFDIYDKLIKSFNPYFKSFFRLAIIIYYDKFRDEKIFEFALWLDFLLGGFRVNQATIVAQTPLKILRGGGQNFLDVITFSYRPEEIFEFIRNQKINDENIEDVYKRKIEDYGAEYGVRNQYRMDNLLYFKKQQEEENGTLANKKKWINDVCRI